MIWPAALASRESVAASSRPAVRWAVDDYFAGRESEFRFERHARLHIVKQ